MTKASVMVEAGAPLEIREASIGMPGEGEVLVRVAASGVCHSDLRAFSGASGPRLLPCVLGHEASAIVERVGEGVRDLAVGDQVVLMPSGQCGECFYCRRGSPTLCRSMPAVTPIHLSSGEVLNRMGAGTGDWIEETIVPARYAVRVDPAMPLVQAALLGCAVVTGFTGAVNAATIKPGSTVAVIGCGGVGLNVVQGARFARAERIIAIDTVAAKLDMARQFGATDTVLGGPDAVAQVLALTGGFGVDTAFEVVGHEAATAQMIAMTRRGGECVFTGLGVGPMQMNVRDVLSAGRRFTGNFLGMCDFRTEFPRLADLYLAGDLLLDELVSRRVGLDDVNEAFSAMEAGEVARSVIVF